MNTCGHTFGDRLRSLRIERNMNQAELGIALGELMGIERVSPQAIGSYERNEREPNLTLLLTMADYFGVSADFLLCHSNERLTAEQLARQSTYELEEIFDQFNVTFESETINELLKQRIIDITTALLWKDKDVL